MFPLSGTFVSCCMNRGCLLGVWMIPFLSKCGTFVAWCMNRGCLLGIEWFHFCQMVQCSPLVSSVPLISQMFPLSSNVFTWVLKCSLMFPWVPMISLEFPSVPLSSHVFPWVSLSSQVFPWVLKCSPWVVHLFHAVWTGVAYWVYEWSHFCQSGTFVACCMNRGCLLGLWMIPFLSKWYICSIIAVKTTF